MGWDGEQHRGRPTRDLVVARFTWSEAGHLTQRVLHYETAAGSDGERVAYLAVERIDHRGGDARSVFAGVVLWKRAGAWLYMKAMSEEMGPYYYDASTKLLDMLTRTQAPDALEWRSRCRANASAPRDAPSGGATA